ncbi:MAG: sulfite exporter TauE/SafE family protein [Pseudomonadota bacterium]
MTGEFLSLLDAGLAASSVGAESAVTMGGYVGAAVVLLLAGLFMGFIAGLFGIGGGGVLVPVLYEVFGALGVSADVRMHLSVGTSLAIIIPTSLRSYLAHRAAGAVDGHVVRTMANTVVAGVLLGAVIARFAEADVLKAVWAVVGMMLAAKFLFARESWRLGEDIPGPVWLRGYGLVTGVISALMSIGGGAFISGMMTLYGRSIHQGIATASAFGPMIAVPGMLGFIWAGWGAVGLPPGSLGYVSLLGAAAIIPTSVFAAPFGARVGHRWSRRRLEIAFGIFVGVVSLRFAFSLLAG